MVLQKMLKDGIMFFWLLSWVFIGFLQSFYALAEDKDKSLYVSCMLLLRGFLQDPDFDIAAEMNKDKAYYGVWLFCLYLFLTSIILLNLLVALFNSSYTNITDSAEKEYLALFTFKVFSYLKSPDQFPYAAPFNLIEVFLVIPWSMCVSRKTYGQINKVIMGTLFGIPVLLIARGERGHYLKLKSTNENDDIQGGRRVYRYLTNENVDDVDDLFLLATQEFEDGQDSVEGIRATTAGQAEEGVTTENSDIWKTTLSPKETFEEFRVRRNKEREVKTALTQRKLQAENESRASRTDIPIASGSSQLTDTLVQSLLASLARMESRQKDLEAMLESHLAKDKESNSIAQANAAATTVAIEAAAAEDEQEVPEERGDDEQ